MISMSKSLQKQMKHFGSDTRQFQMLKNWSKNLNTKQVVLPGVWPKDYPVKNRNIQFIILRKGEEIVFDGSVGIFTRIFLEISRDRTAEYLWKSLRKRVVNALRTIQNALGNQLVLSWKVLHWSQRQKITSFARIGLKICSEINSTKQIFKPTKTMVIPELQYTDRLNLKQWPNAGRKRRHHGRKWLTPYIFESWLLK